MAHLTIRLLGGLEVHLNGAAVAIDNRKAMALLAYLACAPGPHPRDWLATFLWPEENAATCRANLRYSLWRLTDTVGKLWFTADRESIALSADAGAPSDVQVFRQHLARWRSHCHAEPCQDCVDHLAAAASLYRGDFLAGFTLPDSASFDDWQALAAANLRREFGSAVAALADHYARQEEWETAIDHAQRWLAVDALEEAAHRMLMACHARAGRRAAAVHQYEECVRLLDEELGAKPAPETAALCERIRGGALAPRPKPEPAAPPRHNLPQYATSFVGREQELAQLAAHVAGPACRLLTLVGPGGCGKTRLAIQGALPAVDQFADGVWFAPLVGLSTVDTLAAAIAQAVGLRFAGSEPPEEQLRQFLQGKHSLLLLDNFEHLLAGVDLLNGLLAAAPNVKIVVTSRARLNVSGEWLFPVAGLEAPPDDLTPDEQRQASRRPLADYSAVALFVERSRRVDPTFSLETADTALMARLCRLLDGMPLAIELAAPWLRSLTLADIVAEVERGIGLLSTSMRDVPARHHSMVAVFDHTWRLLTAQEQHILCCLSVFRGGFTRQASKAVSGAGLDELSALVDKTWVQMTPSGRYGMHELARQYAAEKLDTEGYEVYGEDAGVVLTRHARYFGAWLAELERQTKQSGGLSISLEVGADYDNVRAGWQHIVSNAEFATMVQYVFGLISCWNARGLFHDAQREIEHVLSHVQNLFPHSDEPPNHDRLAAESIGACLLSHLANYLAVLGRTDHALRCIDSALDRLPSQCESLNLPAIQATVQFNATYVLLIASEYRRAKQTGLTALALHLSLGNRYSAAATFHYLGYVSHNLGDYAEAEHYIDQGLALAEQLTHPGNTLVSLLARKSYIVSDLGNYTESEELARRSLAFARQIADMHVLPGSRSQLARALTGQGRFAEAKEYLRQDLALGEAIGHRGAMLYALNGLGTIALREGDYLAALESFARCVELSHRVKDSLQARLGLGQVAVALEDYTEATHQFRETLVTAQRIGARPEFVAALAGIGQVHAAQGDVEHTIPLLAMAASHPAATYETRTAAAQLLASLGGEPAPDGATDQVLDALVTQVLVSVRVEA